VDDAGDLHCTVAQLAEKLDVPDRNALRQQGR
jgi:hypothetical protein